MGAGVARDLKIKVPGIDLAFGELIYTLCKHLGRYGLIFHNRYGAFQVRYRFNDKARADLIRFSAAALKGAAINNREELFNLNYPGIGNGDLKEYEVRPFSRFCLKMSVYGKKGGLLWHIPLSCLKDLLLLFEGLPGRLKDP